MIRRTPQNRHYHSCKDLQLQIILKYQIGPRAATGFCYSTDCSGTRRAGAGSLSHWPIFRAAHADGWSAPTCAWTPCGWVRRFAASTV